MRKTAIIHVDALRREYPANWILANLLKNKGYRVHLTSRPITGKLVKYFSPDVLILSHVFTLSNNLLCMLKERGTRIYVNEVEGEIRGNEVGISGTYPETRNYNNFDGIFVWSSWSREWLINSRNVSNKKVHAIGCTRLSLLKYVKKSNKNHTVGFISRFEVFNPFDGRHPFENLLQIDPSDSRGRSYIERNNVDAEGFAYGMKVIGKLVDIGIPVIIRPHPNEDLSAYIKVREKFGYLVKIDNGPDYTDFLNMVTHVLGPLSTAFTEPYLLGMPIVSLYKLQSQGYKTEHQQGFVSSFIKSTYAPDKEDRIVEACSNKNLSAIHDSILDMQLDEMYSLKLTIDPIDALLETICLENSNLSLFRKIMNVFISMAKVTLDFMYIIFSLTKKNKILFIRTMYQYHYNSLLHRPTVFMQMVLQKRLGVKSS